MTLSTVGQELKIIMGVGKTPGDTTSTEQSPEVLDLLAGTRGFSVEPGGWTPNLPQIKNGGLWADSGLADGRTLISAKAGNVTESMTITSRAATLQGRYFWEKELLRFSELCADFWDTFGQIEPVYLKWFAPDAPGPQYALLYKIEIAGRGDPFSGDDIQEIVISLEREPYWRGIPPGANPKLWTFYARSEAYTLTDLALGPGSSRHLASASVHNRREWNAARTASISQNWIEIPAADIPGDAPALVCLTSDVASSYTNEGLSRNRIYLARVSKPTSLTTGATGAGTLATLPQYYSLNAGDASMSVDASIVADANAPVSNSSASGNRVTVTFATATMQPRITWAGGVPFDANQFRGQFAVFLRARLSAAAVVSAYIKLSGGVAGIGNTDYNLPITVMHVGVGATPSWYLHYMGVLPIPFWERSVIGIDGLGIEAGGDSSAHNITFAVYASRTSGAGSLYISDLILMPLDEAFCHIDNLDSDTIYPGLDNTGYLSHGKPGVSAGGYRGSITAGVYGGDIYTTPEFIGTPLTLIPNVTNRIYMLQTDNAKGSPINMNQKLFINIVPRWSGVRDR